MAVSYQLVIDCASPETLARFWAEALHYVVAPPPAGFDTWDAFYRSIGVPDEELGIGDDRIVDPRGEGPAIWFQVVPETKSVKNRLHIDVHAGGGRDLPLETRRERVEAEAERLASLGATRVRTIADRLYDRGRAIVAPSSDDTTDITVVRSAPVPDWAADGLASSLEDGRDLDRDALDQRDDEPGRRRALRLLVLAEAERSTALGLGDIATTLGEIATSIDEG